MNKEKYLIGCDYVDESDVLFFLYPRDTPTYIKPKVYCKACGKEAMISTSYRDRDKFEDYFCSCEGAKIYNNIRQLWVALSVLTRKVEKEFKIKELEDEKEHLLFITEQRLEEISSSIKFLKKGV